MSLPRTKPRFFKSSAEFRAWLGRHHADSPELWVGFYTRTSSHAGLTYIEAVEAALCYGWIDGLKRRVDQVSYTHRFTPRRPGSVWSAINTRRAHSLARQGLMTTAGRAAFADRDPKKTRQSTGRRWPPLAPAYARLWKANRMAWTFFSTQPPGYQRLATGWIMSAKLDATRRRRLGILIDLSARQTRQRW